jgi:CBS domain containing-hemolysin-like protein
MFDYLVLIIILAILISFSAFFGGLEVALIAVSNVRAKVLSEERVRGAEALYRLKQNPSRMITTVMVGNNLVNVTASVLAAELAISVFNSLGIAVATGVMTFIILVFGEITPKSYCNVHAVSVSLRFARTIELLGYVFYPFVIVFENISKFLLKAVKSDYIPPSITESELRALVDAASEEKTIPYSERRLLKALMEFKDTAVRSVMTPRVSMFSIDRSIKVKDALEKSVNKGVSRIPVIEGSKDKVVGILHVKNLTKALLDGKGDKPAEIFSVPPLYISREELVSKVFREMQARKTHMAIVLDEFGGVEGLVTLEDILEELVGEITDESDIIQQKLFPLDRDTIIAHGDAEIDDVNEYLKVNLPKGEDYSTISGLLHDLLKDIPSKGKKLKFDDVKLIVEEIKENIPTKIRISKKRK